MPESVIVIVALLTWAIPAAVVTPDTVRVSGSSSTPSSATVRSKEAEPEVCPLLMVTVKSVTAVKSAASAVPAATDTVTAASDDRASAPVGKEAVTVIETGAPDSPTTEGETLRSIEVGGAWSVTVFSSVIVIAAPATVNPSASPDTMSSSGFSASRSSVTVRVKVASPLVSPAGMVRSKSSTAV